MSLFSLCLPDEDCDPIDLSRYPLTSSYSILEIKVKGRTSRPESIHSAWRLCVINSKHLLKTLSKQRKVGKCQKVEKWKISTNEKADFKKLPLNTTSEFSFWKFVKWIKVVNLSTCQICQICQLYLSTLFVKFIYLSCSLSICQIEELGLSEQVT